MRWLRRGILPPRVGVVQSELDRFVRPRYLEIGVYSGTVLLNVRATYRVGVDPQPKIRRRQIAVRPSLWARLSIRKMTSDAFFAASEEHFHVAFIDGLHTYAQAVADTENALDLLAPDGVVLLHDCNPTSPDAAAPDPTSATGEGWCGDVWKAIVHLRATRPDLTVEVLDTDYGIGTVRRTPSPVLGIDPSEIAGLDYSALECDRQRLLGLRSA